MIKIIKEDKENIIGEIIEKAVEKAEGIIDPSKKKMKKYKVEQVQQNKIILIDEQGNGTSIPVIGHENIKAGDEIELGD